MTCRMIALVASALLAAVAAFAQPEPGQRIPICTLCSECAKVEEDYENDMEFCERQFGTTDVRACGHPYNIEKAVPGLKEDALKVCSVPIDVLIPETLTPEEIEEDRKQTEEDCKKKVEDVDWSGEARKRCSDALTNCQNRVVPLDREELTKCFKNCHPTCIQGDRTIIAGPAKPDEYGNCPSGYVNAGDHCVHPATRDQLEKNCEEQGGTWDSVLCICTGDVINSNNADYLAHAIQTSQDNQTSQDKTGGTPPECPVGSTLVNGQCVSDSSGTTKQCTDGLRFDTNANICTDQNRYYVPCREGYHWDFSQGKENARCTMDEAESQRRGQEAQQRDEERERLVQLEAKRLEGEAEERAGLETERLEAEEAERLRLEEEERRRLQGGGGGGSGGGGSGDTDPDGDDSSGQCEDSYTGAMNSCTLSHSSDVAACGELGTEEEKAACQDAADAALDACLEAASTELEDCLDSVEGSCAEGSSWQVVDGVGQCVEDEPVGNCAEGSSWQVVDGVGQCVEDEPVGNCAEGSSWQVVDGVGQCVEDE